ncbi:MAG: 2-dehydropantoate 2-reductase N-terminal domain-containing protein, partial [Gammaproteobacteria bacterium]
MINKILVFGAGYVGASLSVLLAQNYEVALIDVDPLKIKKINNKEAPINEPLLQEFLLNDDINLSASSSYNSQLESTDLIILALPTDYNAELNSFDTSIIESVISDLNDLGTKAAIVIKSTVPI